MIIAFLTNLVILFYLINLYKLIIIYSQNWTSLTLTEPRNAYIMEEGVHVFCQKRYSQLVRFRLDCWAYSQSNDNNVSVNITREKDLHILAYMLI